VYENKIIIHHSNNDASVLSAGAQDYKNSLNFGVGFQYGIGGHPVHKNQPLCF